MKTDIHIQDNIDHNKSHYDVVYKKVDIDHIVSAVNNLDSYISHATTTEISWVGMYYDTFENRVKGKSILELGCGDCKNAAILAALGAKVVANDISDYSGHIITTLNATCDFKYPIEFLSGDFTKKVLEDHSFDFVIGKAFLHHLSEDLELGFLKIINKILKQDGEARFFETAVNSKVLDELRWAMPMNNRPSKWFQPKAFKTWEANDPHPHRDNSSSHYQRVGSLFFNSVTIVPFGVLERFDRILPLNNKLSGKYKRWALSFEQHLPNFLQRLAARSQTIIYRQPKLKVNA